MASVPAGATLSFTAGLTDAARGRVLAFALGAGAPAGARIDPQTGVFTWSPGAAQSPGIYRVTVLLTDPSETAWADEASKFRLLLSTPRPLSRLPSP